MALNDNCFLDSDETLFSDTESDDDGPLKDHKTSSNRAAVNQNDNGGPVPANTTKPKPATAQPLNEQDNNAKSKSKKRSTACMLNGNTNTDPQRATAGAGEISSKSDRKKVARKVTQNHEMKIISRKTSFASDRKLVPTVIQDFHQYKYDEKTGDFLECVNLGPFPSSAASKILAKQNRSKILDRPYKRLERMRQEKDKNVHVALDTVVPTCFEALGWRTHARQPQRHFRLHTDQVTIHVSKQRMFDIMQKSKVEFLSEQLRERGVSGDKKLDEFFAGRVEDEILLALIDRQISVSASIEDSYHELSPEQIDELCRNEPAEYETLNSNDISVVKPIETTGPSTKASLSGKPNKLRYVKAVKLIPRFIGNTTVAFIGREIIGQLNDSYQTEGAKRFMAKLIKSTSDDSTLELHMSGREDLVSDARARLSKKFNAIFAKYNVAQMLSTATNLEVHIKLDHTKDLGIKCIRADEGLWADFREGEQLEQVFGKGAKTGVVIVGMGALGSKTVKPTGTVKKKNEILNEIRDQYENGGKRESDKWIVLKLCVGRDTSFDGFQHQHLVLRNGQGIRHRDGSVYRGKWSYLNNYARKYERANQVVTSNRSSALTDVPKKRKLSGATMQQVFKKHDLSGGIPKKPKRNNPDEGSYIPLNSAPIVRRNSASDKTLGYSRFTKKIKDIQEIVFHGIVHAHFVNKSTWSAHKRLIGDCCDDDCECVLRLDELTKDTVSDFVADRTRKDPNWIAPPTLNQKVGFINFFCKKFMQKVKTSFPKDKPCQTLDRLVRMWREHSKQLRFQGRCTEKCPCMDSWEILFLPACKKVSTQLERNCSNEVTKSGRTGGPTNSIRTPLDSNKKPESKQTQSKQYEIIVKPSRYACGFHCETHTNPQGISKCVVTSVDPRRKAQHVQVHVGTIIESIQVKTQRTAASKERVTSHEQLQRVFEALKVRNDDKSNLILFCREMEEIDKAADCSKDWTNMNSWIGKSENPGWAGGSMVGGDGAENETLLIGAVNPHRGARNGLSMKEKIAKIHRKEGEKTAQVNFKKVNCLHTKSKHREISNDKCKSILRWRARDRPPVESSGDNGSVNLKIDLERNENIAIEHDRNEFFVRPDNFSQIKPIAVQGSLEELIKVLTAEHTPIPREAFKPAIEEMSFKLQKLDDQMSQVEKDACSTNDTWAQVKQAEFDALGKRRTIFNLKKKVLKIFEKSNEILIDTSELLMTDTSEILVVIMNVAPRLHHELDLLQIWMAKFRKETFKEDRAPLIHANCHHYGMSLLHTAVYIGDNELLQKLSCIGADLTLTSNDVGNPLDLATTLKQEADKSNHQLKERYRIVVHNLRSATRAKKISIL